MSRVFPMAELLTGDIKNCVLNEVKTENNKFFEVKLSKKAINNSEGDYKSVLFV
jgi:hypothetical protein